MIRSAWTVLSVVAIANLLAIGGLVGWLVLGDRLDMPRIRALRQTLSVTLTQEKQAADEARAAEGARAAAAAEAEKEKVPPLTAADVLSVQHEKREIDLQELRRMTDEVARLQRMLRDERETLDRERAALDQRVAAFNAMREEIAMKDGEEQFKKALATLEGLKADKARATLMEIMTADGGQTDQVVSYLNAMSPRVRTKVMDEFVKSDPKLAAQLLEDLRTRGVDLPEMAEASGG